MKNGNKLAFPIELNGFGQYAPEFHEGLTKREDFAARFMAAYRSQSDTLDVKSEEVAKWAIEDADALLKALEK